MKPGSITWSKRDLAIGGVLFATLILLAVLQYSWIAQVSEADGARLQQNLRASMGRFAEDFNGEFERLVQIILGVGEQSPSSVNVETVASRAEIWRSSSQHPELLKQIWMADGPDLPSYLQSLAARTEAGPPGGRPGRGGRPPILVDPRVPAFAVPRARVAPPEDSASGWLIVELNLDYMQKTWLPELVARDFGSDYFVEITGGNSPSNVVYQSQGNAHAGPLDANGAIGLFVLRLGPFGRGRGPDGFKGPPPDGEFAKGPKGPPPDGDFGKGPPEFGKGGKEFGKRGFGPGGDEAGWRARASYKSGSTEQMVEGFRIRNLAVSFGILLLMAATVAMLMVSSRRASALAQQQLEFVAGVTHELRTPLAVILSASQNLADGVTSGEQQTRRYGSVIRDQSRRLSGMVEQVLRFAGLSSQHGEVQMGPVEVDALIQGAMKDCQPEFAAAGSEITQDIAEQLPELQGDKAALAHCLRNLLGNAAKHGAGSPIHVSAQAAPNGRVEISVEDNGPGIDAEDLPHIFDPFYRGKRAREEQVQGSGLGLSLVKKIVEAHMGTIEVNSRTNQGTTFRVLLPAMKVS